MRFLEWLVLLPLWRRLIRDPKWHVPAAIGTGIVWVIIIIIIAASSGGGGDDEDKETVREEPGATATVEAEPTEEPTEAPEPTPEPTPSPQPTPTPEPTPAGPATTFGDGTFVVGEDIVPGTYANAGASGCYWERMSGFGGTLDETIANEFTDFRQLVTIRETDIGFTSDGCGTWSQDLSPVTSSPTDPFGDGMYQVGVDIAPGTWRNDGSPGCYWERLSGFSHELDDVITNEFAETQQIVTIDATDVGFSSSDCGVWTKIG